MIEKPGRRCNPATATGFRALAESVEALTRPLIGRRGFAGAAVLTRWPDIVGPRLADHVWPEKITYPRGRQTGGTLHVRLGTGALATELQHLEPVIVERINAVFGFRAVDRLRLVHAPVPPPRRSRPSPERPPPTAARETELAAQVAAVASPALRRQLAALGRALAAGDDDTPVAT
jgi:hypothetical protein